MNAVIRRALWGAALFASLGFSYPQASRAQTMAESVFSCLTDTQKTIVGDLQKTASAGGLVAGSRLDFSIPPARLFPSLVDIERLTEWMPGMTGGAYQDDPVDVGVVRNLMFGGQADVELVLAYDPPGVFAYQITGGFPIEGHLAVMFLDKTPTGTRFVWLQFARTSGLRGALQRRQVRGFVRRASGALADQLDGVQVQDC